eukprot:COSAG01_NODE_35932_length_524_cov_2.943529_1_plen_25_part_01
MRAAPEALLRRVRELETLLSAEQAR